MSYDGWPPNLQSFCSKICLRSQNSWTLILKMHFSIYSPIEFDGQTRKIGGRTHENAWPIRHFGGRIALVRCPKNVKVRVWKSTANSVAEFWLLQIQIFVFCGFQLHESQWITLKNIWKMPTKLVMIECHHSRKLASLLVLKEQT